MRPDVSSWLARATADAEARGLPQLRPLLETLAQALNRLRDADRAFGHPAISQIDERPAG